MRTSLGWPGLACVGILCGCQDKVAPTAPSTGADTPTVDEAVAPAASYAANVLLLPTGFDSAEAHDINSSGDVVGTAWDLLGHAHLVLWVGGVPTDLGTPAGTDAYGVALNDSRTVIGRFYDAPSAEPSGFVWRAGAFTVLVDAFWRGTAPDAVNNRDEVAGTGSLSSVGTRAFRYSAAIGMVEVPPAPGYSNTLAHDLTDQGVLVGCASPQASSPSDVLHAAMWDSSNTFTDLGKPSWARITCALGVNGAGAVVGRAEDTSLNQFPFVWRSATGMRVSFAGEGWAVRISDQGRGIGYTYMLGVSANRAMTKKGNGMTQALPLPAGTSNSLAYGVNRCGDIAGEAKSSFTRSAVVWRIATCD